MSKAIRDWNKYERAIEALETAFDEGRITRQEFDAWSNELNSAHKETAAKDPAFV